VRRIARHRHVEDGLEAWRTLADLDVIYVCLDGFVLHTSVTDRSPCGTTACHGRGKGYPGERPATLAMIVVSSPGSTGFGTCML
jgi:hypothetical protein